jgi:ABC-2 type transport system ATP-binding protein
VPHTLAVIEGREPGREYAVRQPTLIGGDPGADIVLADADPRHASFVLIEGALAVEDVGSTTGTYVNGHRVMGLQRLSPGDRVRLGTTVLEVRAPAEAPAAPAPAAPTPAAAPPPPAPAPAPPAQPPLAAASGRGAPTVVTAPKTVASRRISRTKQIPMLPVLSFVAGERSGTDVPVGGQVVVGRDPGAADVVLHQDSEISRRHATFAISGGGLTVEDLGSTNGTFLNDQRLTGVAPLHSGDKVRLGSTVIEVHLPGEAVIEPPPEVEAAPVPVGTTAPPPNTIDVEGLVKAFGDKRAVDGISLFVNPGEIYGFLGPNGAGKSTTVHMLVTLLPPSGGRARVAGFDISKEGMHVRASIGVALQAAALDPYLNAWQHMDLQTALQGIPRMERKQRAEELIGRVGLTDAADRRVGGYSGGMKRRLDLALALVHRPRVLFLDEPTTGLDPQSRSALWEEVARLVKDEGMTVFLTTQYLEEADVMADRVGIIDHGEIVAEDTPQALKEEIGRPTLEVVPAQSGDYAAVSHVLSRFGELASAAKKGVAVRLRPGADDLAAIVRALDAEGLRLANVELHAPTLDDVFLIKTGRSLEGTPESADGEGEPEPLEQLDAAAGVPRDLA